MGDLSPLNKIDVDGGSTQGAKRRKAERMAAGNKCHIDNEKSIGRYGAGGVWERRNLREEQRRYSAFDRFRR